MPDYSSERECSCCWCCSCTIFVLGLTALFLWLSVRSSTPIISIESFDAFALNKTAFTNSTTAANHTIYYDLKLNNKNKDAGVFYDALNLTFYYASKPINNTHYSAFYQGHKKATHRKSSFNATSGVDWETAAAAVRVNKTAVFRVELATAVRYKALFWKTKRRRLVLRADLKVNDQGILVRRKKKKGITLTSGAAKIAMGRFNWVGILGIWAFVHLLLIVNLEEFYVF